MKSPTNKTAFRRWLSERFEVLEALVQHGEPDFFSDIEVADLVEQAQRLACRFGAGDLIGERLAMPTPLQALAVLGRLLAWSEQRDAPDLLCVRDVAAKLGTSSRSVWRMLSAGQIPPPVKIRGQTKWRAVDLQAMIELSASNRS
jgi:predicted DNA-binding transcriptional regulator AlpA